MATSRPKSVFFQLYDDPVKAQELSDRADQLIDKDMTLEESLTSHEAQGPQLHLQAMALFKRKE